MVCTSCKTSCNVLSHSHVINQRLDQIEFIGLESGLGRLVVAIWEGNAKRTVFSLHSQRFASLYKRSQSSCHSSLLFPCPLATLADPL